MVKHTLLWLLILISGIAAALTARSYLQKDDDSLFKYGRDFPEILYLVEQAYVDDLDMNKLMPGAFQGALESVDPNASYLAPGEPPRTAADEAYRRTGMFVVKLNGYAHLLAVAEGSPAETAGLEAGTYLRKMNHLSTRTMSVNQVRRTLAETKDQILFHVLEPGQAEDREITFQPSDFKMPVMNHQVLEDGIVHLRLPFLYGGFEQDLSRLLDSLDPRARILFDLRGNVLGDDGDLLKLAALFLEKGLLADWIDANGKRVQLLNPVTGPFENRELILLLDSGTHAAAEIFAAVAKQQKRAIVIGQPTHGFLGKYQALPLKNGGHILLPSHKLVLPSGETITGEGVSPDRELEVETVAEQSGDRLLEEALSQIRSGELKKAS